MTLRAFFPHVVSPHAGRAMLAVLVTAVLVLSPTGRAWILQRGPFSAALRLVGCAIVAFALIEALDWIVGMSSLAGMTLVTFGVAAILVGILFLAVRRQSRTGDTSPRSRLQAERLRLAAWQAGILITIVSALMFVIQTRAAGELGLIVIATLVALGIIAVPLSLVIFRRRNAADLALLQASSEGIPDVAFMNPGALRVYVIISIVFGVAFLVFMIVMAPHLAHKRLREPIRLPVGLPSSEGRPSRAVVRATV